MKRNEIVEKIVKEGFSEKTLVKFTDKQLFELSDRILGEQVSKGSVVMKKATTPPAEVKKMTDQGLNVELREKELTNKQKKNIDKNKNGKIDKEDFLMLLKGKKGEKRCEDCDKPHKDCTCNKEYMGEGEYHEKRKEDAKDWFEKNKEGMKLCKGCDKPKSKCECKKDVSELIRFYDDDGERIKDKKGKDSYSSTKDKDFEEKTKSKKEKKKEDKKEVNETKNWVKNLVEKKEFHSFTSKNEIMELIEMKLGETEMTIQHGPKVKKGHNGIPKFMSYDAIVAAAEPKEKPKTSPTETPTKDPGTKTPPKKDPRKTPFKPGPGPNPKPKALKETE